MHTVLAQDTEVVSKAKRRSFTAEYKREVLRQAAACKSGELGALLRREGLYSSHLTSWRREMEERGLAGLSPKKRGPKVTPPSPEELELRRLRREVALLTARAERAETLVDLQKKMASLLGRDLTKPNDES